MFELDAYFHLYKSLFVWFEKDINTLYYTNQTNLNFLYNIFLIDMIIWYNMDFQKYKKNYLSFSNQTINKLTYSECEIKKENKNGER